MTGAEAEADAISRLLAVVGLLNSDLDLDQVLRRISDAGRELVGGDAAGVVVVRGGQLHVLAVTEPHTVVEGTAVPYAGSGIEALDQAQVDTLVLQTADFPAMDRVVNDSGRALRTVAMTRMSRGGETQGALYVFFLEPHHDVSVVALRMLELLAGHAEAAITNAEAYAALRRQREHELAIVDAMADGLAVVDQAGSVVWWSASAAALTGLTQAEVLGQPLPFPQGHPGVGLEHQLDNGRWVEVLSSRLAGQDPAETVVTFRDISAAKMVEEAKDLFLATTGHELRTPLTVIRGFAGTLVQRWDDLTDLERQEAVRIISVRANALGALVDQVLQSSRAEMGGRRLERQPLDLSAALQAAAVDVRSLSDRHTVRVELAGDLPLVLADDQAVRTVLGHLVDNAVKYSPGGGVVTLSAGPSADGCSVCLRVDDEGIGVASEDQDRVFERFFQADGGDNRQHGGFGLGLYIVRRLVQAHDGSVIMVRRPDGRPGSRVEVQLPVTENPVRLSIDGSAH